MLLYFLVYFILNVFCEKFFGNKSLNVVLIAFLRFRDTENCISVKYIFIIFVKGKFNFKLE